jgi:hypothetical protein
MNYNTLTYCIYLLITLYVVIYVGGTIFRNGRTFLINTFLGDVATADAVNKVLLAGYYLMNAGYVILALKIWIKVDSFIQLINVLSFKTGTIILTLGIMHFLNVIALLVIGKKKEHPSSTYINQ